MLVQMVLFTNDEMVLYLFDEDQNTYNYEAMVYHRRILVVSYISLYLLIPN